MSVNRTILCAVWTVLALSLLYLMQEQTFKTKQKKHSSKCTFNILTQGLPTRMVYLDYISIYRGFLTRMVYLFYINHAWGTPFWSGTLNIVSIDIPFWSETLNMLNMLALLYSTLLLVLLENSTCIHLILLDAELLWHSTVLSSN